jgi:hypothetical protein
MIRFNDGMLCAAASGVSEAGATQTIYYKLSPRAQALANFNRAKEEHQAALEKLTRCQGEEAQLKRQLLSAAQAVDAASQSLTRCSRALESADNKLLEITHKSKTQLAELIMSSGVIGQETDDILELIDNAYGDLQASKEAAASASVGGAQEESLVPIHSATDAAGEPLPEVTQQSTEAPQSADQAVAEAK